jgi:hypothetical protein
MDLQMLGIFVLWDMLKQILLIVESLVAAIHGNELLDVVY